MTIVPTKLPRGVLLVDKYGWGCQWAVRLLTLNYSSPFHLLDLWSALVCLVSANRCCHRQMGGATPVSMSCCTSPIRLQSSFPSSKDVPVAVMVWCWHAQLLAPLIDPRVHQLPFAPSVGDFPADLKVSPSYIDTGPTQCQKSSPIMQTSSMSANQNSWMKTFMPTITWMCPPPLKASRSLVTVLICIVVAEHPVEVDPSVPGRVPG